MFFVTLFVCCGPRRLHGADRKNCPAKNENTSLQPKFLFARRALLCGYASAADKKGVIISRDKAQEAQDVCRGD
jgi:hypothetical protein